MANRQPDAAGLLAFFWARFDAKAASDKDLSYLAGAAEEASSEAWQLSDHISDLGGLIECDRDNKQKCGSLQDDEQARLLYRIAKQVEVIGHLAYIGSEADCELRTRLTAELSASRSPHIQIDLQSSTDKEAA